MTLPFILLNDSLYVALMIVAVVAVAMADVCLKRVAGSGSVIQALRSRWMLAAIGLYLLQLILFVVVFVKGWKLSVVGILQTALYAAVTVGAGVLLFDETLSAKQVLGLVLALGAVLLLGF